MVAGKLTAGRNMALNETAVMDQSKEVVRENEAKSVEPVFSRGPASCGASNFLAFSMIRSFRVRHGIFA